MTYPVTTEIRDNIGIIFCDNQPVNALSYTLRLGIEAALKRFEADDTIKAVVLTAKGRTFVAGADITEFGKPPLSPSLIDLINQEDAYTKPIIAALHGTPLGGGLELALGAHYRIADAGCKMGLPEVKLGLIPGAGGTQRLPRAIGPVEAIKMIISGEPIPASKAFELGLIHKIAEGDLLEDAIKFAKTKIRNKTHKRLLDDDTKIKTCDRAEFDKLSIELVSKAKGLMAPTSCLKAVNMVFDTPISEALLKERQIFMDLLKEPQSIAQRYVFFAEREAAKVADMPKDTKPRRVESVAIIGAGTMGGGIAMCFTNVGIPVTLIETSQEGLDRGLAMIRKNYENSVKRGSLTQEALEQRMALFTPRIGVENVGEADMIIEAAFENMALKREIFTTLDRVAKKGAILATNTSTLDINEIAACTRRPADVIGMHFFSPANVMKLLEIVRGSKTSFDVLATALDIGRKIKKISAVVGVCYGFVGNRILHARMAQSEALMLQGASPYAIDRELSSFGFPMGPFQMGDLAGLDVGWRIRQGLGKKAAVFDDLCELGRYGQKTGRGFYIYNPENRRGEQDPEVEAIILKAANDQGVKRREISNIEILERHILPMINEGAKILSEGIAARPSDIDIIWIYGYAWPFWKGGPMHLADQWGVKAVRDKLNDYAKISGDDRLLPCALINEIAESGSSFAEWAKKKA
jgi:3-hydroxyacyl-CoA dehydrogenase